MTLPKKITDKVTIIGATEEGSYHITYIVHGSGETGMVTYNRTNDTHDANNVNASDAVNVVKDYLGSLGL